MILRPYQQDLIDKSRAAMAKGNRRTLVVAPCGAGKTVLASFMAGNHAAQGGNVLFLAHRRELIDQTVRTFESASVPMRGVSVMSVQTAARRLLKIQQPTMVILDECHHAMAKTWRRVLDAFPDAWVVGLTATPCRMDGKGLGDIFQAMVQGVTTADLIQQNWLAPYRYIAPPSGIDLTGVRTVRGDFDSRAIAEIVDRPKIVGSAVEQYQRYAPGSQAIAYCASIDHSQHTAEAFAAAGIRAAHIDGNTLAHQRDWIIEQFRKRKIMVLSNVDLLGEGFDVPACDACIMLRPTKSTALYIQQSMRCMRPGEGKTAIILDHVGNYERHGFPDDDRDWSLDGKKKQPRAKAPVVCRHCYGVYDAPPHECPYCGVAPERAEIDERREVEQVDGQLREITAEQRREIAKARRVEEAQCRSYDDFMRLAMARGYRPGWAYHRSKQRGYL